MRSHITSSIALALTLAATPGCLAASTRAAADALLRDPGPARAPGAAAIPDIDKKTRAAADEDALAGEARLDTILRVALSQNPDLDEARERTRAAAERAKAAGRLPDLEANAEIWAVPLNRPWAVNQAQMIMFGLRQSFPAPGSRDALARAALEDARITRGSGETRALDIAQQVKRAFASYVRAVAEDRIHQEHVAFGMRLSDLARDRYRAGRGTQQDVLRTLVELSRLHTDVEAIVRLRDSSRALLNTLMGRAPDAPLGPPVAPPPAEIPADAAKTAPSTLDARRPEIAAAGHAIRRSESQLDAARALANRPGFMVGADYWLMPTDEHPHAWSAMFSMTLPWLNPQRRAEVRAAQHVLAADRRALDSTRRTVRYQVIDAVSRLEASAHTLAVIERDLLPRARDSFDAAIGAYATGQGDALSPLDAERTYLEVRLEEVRARARVDEGVADLERALGTELPREAPRAGGQP